MKDRVILGFVVACCLLAALVLLAGGVALADERLLVGEQYRGHIMLCNTPEQVATLLDGAASGGAEGYSAALLSVNASGAVCAGFESLFIINRLVGVRTDNGRRFTIVEVSGIAKHSSGVFRYAQQYTHINDREVSDYRGPQWEI